MNSGLSEVGRVTASISRIIEEARGDDQVKQAELADQFRSLLHRIKGDIEQDHDALHRAVTEAAASLGVSDEAEVGQVLAHIEAEKHRSSRE